MKKILCIIILIGTSLMASGNCENKIIVAGNGYWGPKYSYNCGEEKYFGIITYQKEFIDIFNNDITALGYLKKGNYLRILGTIVSIPGAIYFGYWIGEYSVAGKAKMDRLYIGVSLLGINYLAGKYSVKMRNKAVALFNSK